MKMTTGILGCALVAGLMTFAAAEAQAGVVINNVLYSPLKIKIAGQYVKNGKIAKFSFNSKEVLKDLGYNSNVKLAVAWSGDVWIINKDATVKNISLYPNDFLFITFGTYVGTYSGKNNNTYTEAGVSYVNFYDNGEFLYGTDSDNWFETQGVYSYKDVDGNTNKQGYYNDHESYNAKALNGDGHFIDVTGGTVPVTGSASYNGSGKILD